MFNCTMRPFVLALILCMSALPDSAKAEQYDLSVDCNRVEKEGGGTYEMGQCAGRARLAAQAQLDRTVKQLQKAMRTPSGLKALNAAQASWSAWKTKEADLCASAIGYSPEGSGYGFVWSNCAAFLTNQRINVLKGYLREIQSR